MTPEGKSKIKIKNEVKKGLDDKKIYYFCPVQTGYGKRTVDILCCIDGKFVAIEVKRPDMPIKPKMFQKDVLEEVRASGGIGIVATCWKDVAIELSWNYVNENKTS
jgi:hypothetical protein